MRPMIPQAGSRSRLVRNLSCLAKVCGTAITSLQCSKSLMSFASLRNDIKVNAAFDLRIMRSVTLWAVSGWCRPIPSDPTRVSPGLPDTGLAVGTSGILYAWLTVWYRSWRSESHRLQTTCCTCWSHSGTKAGKSLSEAEQTEGSWACSKWFFIAYEATGCIIGVIGLELIRWAVILSALAGSPHCIGTIFCNAFFSFTRSMIHSNSRIILLDMWAMTCLGVQYNFPVTQDKLALCLSWWRSAVRLQQCVRSFSFTCQDWIPCACINHDFVCLLW